MRTVLEILEFIRPGVDLKNRENLVDEGILDSFALVSLIGELNDEYGITIPIWEIAPDNFKSVEAIERLVEKQRNK